jgi:integrase
MKRYAKPRTRSWAETQRILDRYVTPAWKGRPIADVRRSDMTQLLDQIEDKSGPVMADHVLAIVRKLFNWYAARDEEFRSPIVKGMARTKPKDRARKRTLSDVELRALWAATATIEPAVFGSLVRFLLLTAQRRDEAARARWSEIEDKIWTIPGERYKTGDPNSVPVTSDVEQILKGVLRRGAYVFTTTGKTPFSGFSKAKARFDEQMLAVLRETDPKAKLEPWVLHDLRRTARSLMSRAGVSPDHAERVLGHVIPGVRGVYDRHSFVEEKRDALTKLGALVARIVNPPADNVVALRA